jgi:hypothetical protein
MHHLWHMRALSVTAQLLQPAPPQPAIFVPLLPFVSLELSRRSLFDQERAHPPRFASPWPELRGAVLLTFRIPF